MKLDYLGTNLTAWRTPVVQSFEDQLRVYKDPTFQNNRTLALANFMVNAQHAALTSIAGEDVYLVAAGDSGATVQYKDSGQLNARLLAIGGAGNDSFTGSIKDDLLKGGGGDDILAGNGGSDIFWVGEGTDTVYGFNQTSKLVFDNGNMLVDGQMAELSTEGEGWIRVSLKTVGGGTVNVQLSRSELNEIYSSVYGNNPGIYGSSVANMSEEVRRNIAAAFRNKFSVELDPAETHTIDTLKNPRSLGTVLDPALVGTLRSAMTSDAQAALNPNNSTAPVNGFTYTNAANSALTESYLMLTGGTTDMSVSWNPNDAGADVRSLVAIGGTGNDTISGSTKADLLLGGLGNDLLIGNGGNDVFGVGQGEDAIRGFNRKSALVFSKDSLPYADQKPTIEAMSDGNVRVSFLTQNGKVTLEMTAKELHEIYDDAIAGRVPFGEDAASIASKADPAILMKALLTKSFIAETGEQIANYNPNKPQVKLPSKPATPATPPAVGGPGTPNPQVKTLALDNTETPAAPATWYGTFANLSQAELYSQAGSLLGLHTTTSSHFATTGTSSTLTVGGKTLANIENMKNGFFDEAANAAIVNFQSAPGTLSVADPESTVNYRVFGSGKGDQITTAAGNDIIWGASGDDTIDGGAGNDYIIGGKGKNTLTGGSGDDTFVIEAARGNTRTYVRDFSENDKLILENAGNIKYRYRGGEANSGYIEILSNGGMISTLRTSLSIDQVKERVTIK